MSILTNNERYHLAKVRTTPDQARTIRKRNLALLEFLEKINTSLEENNFTLAWNEQASYGGRVGCPHCSPAFACKTCAWNVLAKADVSFRSYTCTRQTFGRISLNDLDGFRFCKVHYGNDREFVTFSIPCSYPFRSEEERQSFKAVVRYEITACRIFLLGHIEWANLVLDNQTVAGEEKTTST
ncbi:MAG: hypothetical protein WC525_07570 [Candidatus Thermoplasmatota archaeon]